ncbi:MAG: hypothetical protein QGI60_04590 [archaeon]|jgi:hypothetical protein|nr:hypothetical protein [archaeon]
MPPIKKRKPLVTGEMKLIRRGPVPTRKGLPLVTGEMKTIRAKGAKKPRSR